jgi:hypothetical protein
MCRMFFFLSSFLCFAHTLWLRLFTSCSGRPHSTAATRGLLVPNVNSGSGHVTTCWQRNRGYLVRGITFPVLSPQHLSSTISCLVLFCLVVFTLLVFGHVLRSVLPVLFPFALPFAFLFSFTFPTSLSLSCVLCYLSSFPLPFPLPLPLPFPFLFPFTFPTSLSLFRSCCSV